MKTTVRLQAGPFDPGLETNAFLAAANGAGAAVTFTGLVRSSPGSPVEQLVLECYPELATHELERLLAEATERFGLLAGTIIHRFGALAPGEPIVQVMTSAPHRAAAFAAAEYLMDFLKTDAPFWKKEIGPSGASWVEPRAADDAAKERWKR